MDEKPGTKVGKRSVKQEKPIDCRTWVEFRIIEVLYDRIKLEYRTEIDRPARTVLEFEGESIEFENM